MERALQEQFGGRVALVTGAGSAMGRATAILLAARGAAVTLIGRRENKLADVAAEIAAAGGRALVHAGDVSSPAVNESAVARAVEHFGALHYAVNYAGVSGTFVPLPEMTPEQWQRTIDIDLSSLFYGLKYEIPAILDAGGGAIVNVSSVFGDRGGPTPEYSSAKHAIRGLTRTAAIEFGSRGMRVNELQPGVIDTEMAQGNVEGTREVVERGIPMRRVGTGREIATAVAFLLSHDASYINGAHLAVDGGFLA